MCEREAVDVEHIAGPVRDQERENLRRVSDVANAPKAKTLVPDGFAGRLA